MKEDGVLCQHATEEESIITGYLIILKWFRLVEEVRIYTGRYLDYNQPNLLLTGDIYQQVWVRVTDYSDKVTLETYGKHLKIGLEKGYYG